MITWDEEKRAANLEKHGLDFAAAETVFDGPVIAEEDSRLAYGEQRINLIGLLHGAVVFMTYTERDGDLHIISLRSATRHEAKHYFRTAFHA
jgi:uncharacterized DUF497 family protein